MTRVYVRKFDHDEARRRHRAGESLAAIARSLGVSSTAVWRIVDPKNDRRMRMLLRLHYLGICEECRGPCLDKRHPSRKVHGAADGRQLCVECRHKASRQRLEFDGLGRLVAVRCSMLDCANGERWQPPEHFTRGNRFRDVRRGGIHGQCRACQTRARQRYRAARKVPCASCGAPCLPGAEKGRRFRDTGLCLDCYRQTLRRAAA